jgi:glucose-1-phosphate thymidylyltransferase
VPNAGGGRDRPVSPASGRPRGGFRPASSAAVQRALIKRGARVESEIVGGWWKDAGQLEDLLEANRLVLEDLVPQVEGELVESEIVGRAVVERGARLERSVVRGPVVIGSGSHIVDAYVGPFTAIGSDVSISNAEIEHSIVLTGSEIRNLDKRMETSLLGRGVSLTGGNAKPKTLRFLIGDHAKVSLP